MRISRHGYPVLALLLLGGGAFAWYAHGSAARDNDLLGKTWATPQKVVVYNDLDVAQRAARLFRTDREAWSKLLFDHVGLRLADVLDEGKTITVERQTHRELGHSSFVCIRPEGEPNCYWTADTYAMPQNMAEALRGPDK